MLLEDSNGAIGSYHAIPDTYAVVMHTAVLADADNEDDNSDSDDEKRHRQSCKGATSGLTVAARGASSRGIPLALDEDVLVVDVKEQQEHHCRCSMMLWMRP